MEPYCSDDLYCEFLAQQSKRCGTEDLGKILRSVCSSARKSYLTAKVMTLLAEQAGFQSMLLTITCPPDLRHKVFSGEAGIEVLYEYLSEFWRRVIKSISKKFCARKDFFGIRVTELHEDGVPHWHILFFCNEECSRQVREKILRAMLKENRDPSYVTHHANDFIKSQSVDLRSTGLSYIFKSAFAWRHEDLRLIESSMRQKAAISCVGASQFQLIGANGFTGVMNLLHSALNDEEASPDIFELAASLRNSNLQRGDLSVMRELFSDQSEKVEVLYSSHQNRFGEHRRKASGIKACAQTEDVSVREAVTGNSSSDGKGEREATLATPHATSSCPQGLPRMQIASRGSDRSVANRPLERKRPVNTPQSLIFRLNAEDSCLSHLDIGLPLQEETRALLKFIQSASKQ